MHSQRLSSNAPSRKDPTGTRQNHSEHGNDPVLLEKKCFAQVMVKATDRWLEEANRRHTHLLSDLRDELTVPGAKPCHRAHIDTCIRCLDAALNCPTPHLDLSLLPPGHALSDAALDLFMQRRALISPPLRSITLPARSTHLPSYLGHLVELESIYAPDFAGGLHDLAIGASWKTLQLGYFTPGNSPELTGDDEVVDRPEPTAIEGLEIILRPARDDIAQQSFGHLGAEFVRLFRQGSSEYAQAVALVCQLTHALHWYSPTLDLSQAEPGMLERAAQFGLFERFDDSHRPRGLFAIQRPDRGITAFFVPREASLELTLPADLPAKPWWLAQLKGLHHPGVD